MKESKVMMNLIILFYFIVRTIQAPKQLQVKGLQIGKFTITYENSNSTQNQTFYSFVPRSDQFYRIINQQKYNDTTPNVSPSISVGRNSNSNLSLKIGLAIYYMQQFRDELNNGILFGVTPLFQKSSILIVFSHFKTMKWKNLRISYILTNRRDIFCGNLILERQLKNQIKEQDLLNPNKSLQIRQNVKQIYISTRVVLSGQNFSRDKNRKIIFFISAIQCNVSTMSISIRPGEQKQVDSKSQGCRRDCFQFFLKLRLSNISKQFQVFNVTYIVYSQNGAVIVRNSPSYLNTYIQYLQFKQDHKFSRMIGLISFNGTNFAKFTSNPIPYYRDQDRDNSIFYQQFDNIFLLQQIQIIYRQNLTLYIKQSIREKKQLLKFKNRQYISYDLCLKNKGQVLQTRQKVQLCAICGQNQRYNPKCLKCECKQNQNYAFVGGQCLSLQRICNSNNDLIYQNGTCYTKISFVQYCRIKFYRNYNSTINDCHTCISKFVEVQVEGKNQTICVPYCNQKFYYDIFTDRCLCLPGYIQYNQTCIWSSNLSCGPMYYWNEQNNRCQCKEESVRGLNGQCIYCSRFQKFNQEEKKCQVLKNRIQTSKRSQENKIIAGITIKT